MLRFGGYFFFCWFGGGSLQRQSRKKEFNLVDALVRRRQLLWFRSHYERTASAIMQQQIPLIQS
jgi:hypothetical protein